MYDNLDLILYKETCKGIDLLREIPQHLTNISNHGENQFGKYCLGYLDNLKVSITEKKVKIYNSSLCKYYLGDNFKTLSKGDTKRAIEKISDSLHLPFQFADVTRIDFAQNFIMQHNEKAYYPYLGETRHYNRLQQNNGIYYNNQLRQLLFYGKVHEQRVKKQPIPELYKNRNVLRFEYRLKKDLKRQLKQPDLKAGILSDEKFYSSLVKRWKNEYLAIQKIKSKVNDMKPTGSTKEFIENLALFQLIDLGQPQILSKVKEWQDMGLITKTEALRLREKIKEISKIPIEGSGNDLIKELDRKIKEAANNW